MRAQAVPTYTLFGIELARVPYEKAIGIVDRCVRDVGSTCATIFFVNTHTLNLSIENREYRRILNASDYVFGDGTGVRWASRLLAGQQRAANINGTDLVPEYLRRRSRANYSCFLLGATSEELRAAAAYVERTFSGWRVVDWHHGYLETDEMNAEVVDRINRARPEILLVGMGNPLQEQWIHANRDRLAVPLVIGVGGLFSYWSGNLKRSPLWLRRIGMEWISILVRQPHKWKRYLLGNAKFLFNIAKEYLHAKSGNRDYEY